MITVQASELSVRPDPGSDGGVRGSSIPQRDDVLSGSDGYDHTTYLISHYELLPQDCQQLMVGWDNTSIEIAENLC